MARSNGRVDKNWFSKYVKDSKIQDQVEKVVSKSSSILQGNETEKNRKTKLRACY